ncbi:agmatine deiminase family protein [Galbibacter sp. BG1]|uniref:agmatine deiminase family protein n=1 Tax=Galbibacter sp. BG1 TaxID=1170699 RepID=UPI0015B9B288|nr:agmatine deiminase family protein [Galbibacter sp. BG1]QLE02788.1 agmatine deiminase family protein [Galbibacter sp. BG1]
MRLLTFFIVIIITGCSEQKKAVKEYSFPPEWEPHEAVWIDINDYWSPYSVKGQITTRLEIVKALHEKVTVKVLTTSDSLSNSLLEEMVQMSIDTSKIKMVIHPLPNNFIRDTGPIFLTNGDSLVMANWNWKCINLWCDETNNLRGTIDDSLASRFGYSVKSSPINYEGGAIVVNNHSALSILDYALEQNEGKIPIEDIETSIKDLYGKDQVIWLKGIPLIERNGLKIENYFGAGADGHIDALVRFANDSTLLVTTISEEDKLKSPLQEHDYEIFQNYLKQLQKAKRVNGMPFTIVEIPSPDISLHVGTLPASVIWQLLEQFSLTEQFSKEDMINYVPVMGYANYLVSNEVVLVSQYWEKGLPESEKRKDENMIAILKKYFPNREIIGISAKALNWDGGGIHCSTQQEPRIN